MSVMPPGVRPEPPNFSPMPPVGKPTVSVRPQPPQFSPHPPKLAVSQREKDLRAAVLRAKGVETYEINKALRNAVPDGTVVEGEPFNKLLEALDSKSQDVKKSNRDVLHLLRKCLASPTYVNNKDDESHPAVKLVHNLLLASYTEPDLMNAFHELGRPLKSKKDRPLHEHLSIGRDRGYKRGLIKSDKTIQYIVKYFKQIIGAFFSTKFGTKLAGIFGKAYDPRGELNNNAGKLFDAKLGDVAIRSVYTPSPTIGDDVAPEVRGVLQAMKNRSKMTPDALALEKYPYVAWNYTNLQSLMSADENGRATSIMKLQSEFPDQFQGISVTLDSAFYRAGVHGANEAKIQQAISDDTPLNPEYKQQQVDELLADANFTLVERVNNPGGGYYFPSQEWKEACKDIVDKAYALCVKEAKPEDKKWNWYQKAAFRELVAMGLIKYSQELTAAKAPAGGRVMVTAACKENIDRGGKTNACFLWALGGDEQEVFSAFHARALLGRHRLVLPDRVEPMYALLRVMPQQAVHDFLNSVGQANLEKI
ncbi:MAG: hypothetical protein JSR37_02085 [Verrucomicrobia bacterium]|nr:hypothetical protein [Verrucomicrobiota bacterium]MBS0637653.1 hypothetical protein [Verrucomicrobiota bacterium]